MTVLFSCYSDYGFSFRSLQDRLRMTYGSMPSYIAFFAVSFMLSGVSLAAPETKKVPTTRVIVPDDAPAADNGDDEPIITIPTEDLPPITEPQPPGAAKSPDTPDKIPQILRDFSALPPPVQQTRKNLLEAARSGNIENLRPFIGLGENPTSLSLGGLEGDPIDYLKSTSGDDEGRELLAILIEILEMGYVRTDEGTEDELFVWPYFFAVPLDKLTPPQKVELFRILTAGDLQDSTEFGSYIFYRTAIKPDGTWSFFLAGD
ncbi:cytoplasmic protein [Pseudahrensia aquimaris]|uniref:Cytoplasmic protein n=1 Tax=Pseudahrensia aquimaris TaxID=744461 RepID=A0ABW3FBB3_9HYPH